MEQLPPQGSYQIPRQDNYRMTQEPVAPVMTVGKWIVTYLLLMIPLVNIILMIVWAVSDTENPNRKNWAIAMLIFWAISIVIAMFAWGAIIAAMGGLSSALGQ